MPQSIQKATIRETLGFAADVFAPTVAKGVIIRRPAVVKAAQRFGLDSRAVRRMQRLRDRYGDGPLMLRLPLRKQAIVLSPAAAMRVLEESPEPFDPASSEKRAALEHFQPDGVLVSRGPIRAERRQLNEAILETGCPRHSLARNFAAIVDEEAEALVVTSRGAGILHWQAFTDAWFRIVRRGFLGDAARADRELTDMLARLREDANWAFLHPKRDALRAQFDARLRAHVERAEPGSLAGIIAHMHVNAGIDVVGQIPQWLFASDAAGIAAFRALAMVATHPVEDARARAEIAAADRPAAPELPFLRACVLESVRLWPTTPMILRQTRRDTEWEHGSMPANTGVLVYVPFFHRDGARLPFADRFTPDVWLDGRASESHLIPFSAGPVVCPGRELVLFLTSTLIAAILARCTPRVSASAGLDSTSPLPGTLDNFSLAFSVE